MNWSKLLLVTLVSLTGAVALALEAQPIAANSYWCGDDGNAECSDTWSKQENGEWVHYAYSAELLCGQSAPTNRVDDPHNGPLPGRWWQHSQHDHCSKNGGSGPGGAGHLD